MVKVEEWANLIDGMSEIDIDRQITALNELHPAIIREFEGLAYLKGMFEGAQQLRIDAEIDDYIDQQNHNFAVRRMEETGGKL